jgi:hypothetical protein
VGPTSKRRPILHAVVLGTVLGSCIGAAAPFLWLRALTPDGSAPIGVIESRVDHDVGLRSRAAPAGPVVEADARRRSSARGDVLALHHNCRIEIRNPQVVLRDGPSDKETAGTGLAPGAYPVDGVSTVVFADDEQRWFLISVDDRRGWLEDDPAQVAARSAACLSSPRAGRWSSGPIGR